MKKIDVCKLFSEARSACELANSSLRREITPTVIEWDATKARERPRTDTERNNAISDAIAYSDALLVRAVKAQEALVEWAIDDYSKRSLPLPPYLKERKDALEIRRRMDRHDGR